MVRLVQTLWFETISVLSQPFIDTPIGMITVRQAIIVGVGAVLGYAIYRLVPSFIDPFVRIGIGIIPFALCLMTAAKKVKTVPPEQYLLLMLQPRARPGSRTKGKSEGENKNKSKSKGEAGATVAPAPTPVPAPAERQAAFTTKTEAEAAVPSVPAPAEEPPPAPVRLRPVEEVPEEVRKTLRTFLPPLKAVSAVMGDGGEVTVSEVLKNPKTGASLLNTKLYASVGSRIVTATSDEKGAYTVKFYPGGPGSYYVLVAVQGFGTPVDSVLINVARRQ